jgi:formate dehydrogenase iron-sulfur subunit
MALPLHDRAVEGQSPALVRLTENGLVFGDTLIDSVEVKTSTLLPGRMPAEGEQYRFHFDMTKCIGCRSCEVACNEQNGNPADITWRRVGELEGGTYPETQRHYLSMGCNHCLDADCLRGCPVNAYTKDVSGIVLHSADACIGCSYCVWNCPYSVPQFNPERGVVGKCDMCKGRLDDGLEPACVNACPEGAIEIEIVNMLAWRGDFAGADSPGMPAAEQTISTTRITLPEETGAPLERVDTGQIQPEHAHMPLVFMTTMMQAVAGALWVLLAWHGLTAVRLGVLLGITAAALTLSTLHLGRPAYAYRALKMWRRSWLSREVLLFTLFFAALAAAAAATGAAALGFAVSPREVLACDWAAAVLGLLGTLASAAIYLVKARPAWNMQHTPLDFLLTGGLLGSLLAVALEALRLPVAPVPALASLVAKLQGGAGTYLPTHGAWLVLSASIAWAANQGLRAWRLRQSTVFEAHAAFSLLSSERFRPYVGAAAGLAVASVLGVALGHGVLALAFGAAAVLLARYLFFVTVVPLNMALTFVRSRHA